jgi:hypothetical protein
LAALLKTLQKFAESSTEDAARAGTAKAQLAKQATNAAPPVGSGLILAESTEHFGDLVPVLVTRNREQSQ